MFQTYLDHLYCDAIGHVKYSKKQLIKFEDQNVCPTYGELLFPSLAKLLKSLKLNENDTFLDLGSGLGKLAMMVFYLSSVQQVKGIEASMPLFKISNQKLNQFKSDCFHLFEGGRILNIEYGNFLEADLHKTTIAYACSTCFSSRLLNKIGIKMNQTPSIRYVLSLRPLPSLTRLKFLRVEEIECSWDSALCYIYGK